MEELILVDIFDNKIGTMEKLTAHKNPTLHSAFSLFIHKNNKLLLQKRNINKYHSGGLWANSCCSHPRPNKTFSQSVKERVEFELGIKNIDFIEIDKFIYLSQYSKNLFEYELDHVLVAEYNGEEIKFNPDEIEQIEWVSINQLEKELVSNPQKFATWFISCAPKVIQYIKEKL